MINNENLSILKVDITKKDLYRTCYWTALKYKNDRNHYQKVGNKTEMIGCYLDHWIQKLPERLILNQLVEKKDYSIVEDNFIYGQDTKKNSPDLIGLKKENKIIPLALYNNGNWKMVKNAPFVEVKTFKNNQLLVTIPESQFDDDKYYVIVKSNLKEDYLLNIFDDKFYEKCDLDEFETYSDLVLSDDKLINPSKVEKPKNIGSYELLGIYKGFQIKQIAIMAEKNKYYYLKSIRNKNSENKINKELKNGLYCHSNNEILCCPFCIKKEDKDSKIICKNEGKTFIDVLVEGKVRIDNYELNDGNYRLKFEKFDKTSESIEVIVPRNTLQVVFDSKHEELIKELDEFVKNQSL
ncbi:hypothetical protein [Methanobrevibacter sp.]|uniref:hypothetical protein n=1 Tax=Methanobrevibacter sp. TaxID=66852 RepID=UPI00388E52A0